MSQSNNSIKTHASAARDSKKRSFLGISFKDRMKLGMMWIVYDVILSKYLLNGVLDREYHVSVF